MIEIDLKSRKSIYEQVVRGIKEQILSGIIAPESKLPSVRELSKELTVNPNTVQKAFRHLESQGYIYSVSGVGSFAHSPQDIQPDERMIAQSMAQIRDDIRDLRMIIPDSHRFETTITSLLSELRESHRQGSHLSESPISESNHAAQPHTNTSKESQ
ncbi:GntR family transcriptional regulator [Bifidobacterium aquikefiri]|uniref:GntR family transcriptional regulator n=1 Tax=Bifidobacterium aquikefiri TaxID=1653207 RepID=UPI0023F04482|nr:GntR family transcriptional regulator [Bifidobacterium aquikefiri]